MYCMNCGGELLVGAISCPHCGHPVDDADIDAKTQRSNAAWLAETLTQAGYRAKVLERDKNKLLVGRASRMDFLMDIRDELDLIIIHRSWAVAASGQERRSELLMLINEANRMSQLCTFYLDSEGKTIKARSYIAFSEKLDGPSLVTFMKALEVDIPHNVLTSELLDISKKGTQWQ